MGKCILKYTQAAIPTPKRQKQISQLDIKKEKNPPMKKRTKKSHCRCARKTGPIRQAV